MPTFDDGSLTTRIAPIAGTLSRDTRDDVLDATHGQFFSQAVAAGFGFLEEDCDASLFLATARQAGLAITFRDVTCADRHSRIRNYDPYSPERARKNLANLRGAVL